jgi:hypothetical protein
MPRLGSWLEKGWWVPILVPRQQNLPFLTLLISRNEQVRKVSRSMRRLSVRVVEAAAVVRCGLGRTYSCAGRKPWRGLTRCFSARPETRRTGCHNIEFVDTSIKFRERVAVCIDIST